MSDIPEPVKAVPVKAVPVKTVPVKEVPVKTVTPDPDRVRRCNYALNVMYNRNSFRINADQHDQVSSIKKELEEITGVPAKDQVLNYNGVGFKLQDDKTLHYYRCSSGGFYNLTQKNQNKAGR